MVVFGPECPRMGSGLALIFNINFAILIQRLLARNSWACQEEERHILSCFSMDDLLSGVKMVKWKNL
jgi:hypothetical protein